MTVREVINALINMPDLDKPFQVEISKKDIPQDYYEWIYLDVVQVGNYGCSSVAITHKED